MFPFKTMNRIINITTVLQAASNSLAQLNPSSNPPPFYQSFIRNSILLQVIYKQLAAISESIAKYKERYVHYYIITSPQSHPNSCRRRSSCCYSR